MFKDYKIIFFDCGGTLLYQELNIAPIHNKLRELGTFVDLDSVEKSMIDALEYYVLHCYEANTKDDCAKLRGLCKRIFLRGIGIDNGEISFYLRSMERILEKPLIFRLYPETKAVLDELKGMGYPLGVISNWDIYLEDHLNEAGILLYFDLVISSSYPFVRSQKPHSRIFEIALEKAGCTSREVLHIGDDYEADIVGARGVDITPIFIDRNSDYRDKEVDCIVINDLREIISYLSKRI